MVKFKTRIIAEAGVNHNGSLLNAKKLVDYAKASGADFIKFQTFKAEKVASTNSPTAEYQKKSNIKTQYELLKNLELSRGDHIELIEYCKKKEIKFLSSAFDLESIDLLVELGQNIFKIPSGEITNLPYLKKISSVASEVIISTGMSTINEIHEALKYFKRQIDNNKITLLQCNTEYPTPFSDVNLNVMKTLKNKFKVSVGFSDHTVGVEVCIAAVALGATLIEKHFTIDKNMEGPDHSASLEPDELKYMINSVRNVEQSLGDGVKKPSKSEIKNIDIVRRSIHASCDIIKGDVMKEENFIMLRPGSGISPMKILDFVGKISKVNISKGDIIKKEYFD